MIVDTGKRDRDQDEDDPAKVAAVEYTKSSHAHSTLIVDGKSFTLDGNDYGSALDAQGTGSGWYAMEGRNPLVRRQGVTHKRLFLYRPGHVLVILDRVSSSTRHTYGRYFQVAPDIGVERKGASTALRAAGFEGTIWDMPTSKTLTSRLYRGQTNPWRGWYVPGGWDSFTPRYSLLLRSEALHQPSHDDGLHRPARRDQDREHGRFGHQADRRRAGTRRGRAQDRS